MALRFIFWTAVQSVQSPCPIGSLIQRSHDHLFHIIEALLCGVLGLLRHIWVFQSRLQTSSPVRASIARSSAHEFCQDIHIIRILCLVRLAANVSAIVLVVENLFRVLLGVIGGV